MPKFEHALAADFLSQRELWKTYYPSEDGEALQIIEEFSDHLPRHASVPAAGWFALYTTSRHEKRVAEHLGQREIEHYLPLYRSKRKWRDGSRVTLELPLFPGYVFVRILRSERVKVLEVPGALAVVMGTGGQPAVLPDATVQALRSGLREREAEPHPLLTAGQRARICSGAFAGLEGVVVRQKNRCRIVLTLEHIMRSFSVELGIEDIEPLASDAYCVAVS
jgi:transcription antitermination factor NusG